MKKKSLTNYIDSASKYKIVEQYFRICKLIYKLNHFD